MDIISFFVLFAVLIGLVVVLTNLVGSIIEIALYGTAALVLIGGLFFLVDSLNLGGAVAVGKSIIEIVFGFLLG